MKHETNYRSPRRRFGLSFVACLAVVSALFASQLSAGLINVNFTNTTASGLNPDGPGVLGAGTWNRIIFSAAGATTALFDRASGSTTATLSQSSGAAVAGGSQANGNPVQNESWTGVSFIVTVTGLVANQVYKVAVYSDKIGSGGGTDTYVVNGLGITLPNPGASVNPLPGTAGTDYAIFQVTATSGGQISVAVPGAIAGLQIQGVLNGESGPQMDCLITKSASSTTGKGGGVYKVKPTKKQTISKKVKGSKALKTFVNVQNDGAEIDNCYLMGFWKKKHFKKVVIRDRATGANVTAATMRGRHRFILDAGSTKGFSVKAKRAKQRSRDTSLQVCASPSTQVASKQDCVTSTIK